MLFKVFTFSVVENPSSVAIRALGSALNEVGRLTFGKRLFAVVCLYGEEEGYMECYTKAHCKIG